MTAADKLAAILAAVQTDPGNRGLARDPHDNLFTATAGDFEAACRSIAEHDSPVLGIVTGFYILTAMNWETDGPLGAVFIARALTPLGIHVQLATDPYHRPALKSGVKHSRRLIRILTLPKRWEEYDFFERDNWWGGTERYPPDTVHTPTHQIALERVGPAADGRCRNMRGIDVTDSMRDAGFIFDWPPDYPPRETVTIGIGDGGNEIGMGKIPHETVVKNIPNGDLIHCRVPTDHLIVAGVSNWGAYALAAGVFVLRGVTPPPDLFDPDREREILEVMVREGPLVDGVTGKQTATVDGLTWDEYAKPLIRIGEILKS